MITHSLLRTVLLGCGLACCLAQAAPLAVDAHDGQHDFDFNVGIWKTHIQRTLHPLSGPHETMEMNGTVTVRPIWQGRAQLEEIEVDGPQVHWQAATLFLYNPQSRQWSQNYVNSSKGTFSGNNPLIGQFRNGRGELFSQDTIDGHTILVRGTWSDISADGHRYEEAYSVDGGRTWETVISAQLEKMP